MEFVSDGINPLISLGARSSDVRHTEVVKGVSENNSELCRAKCATTDLTGDSLLTELNKFYDVRMFLKCMGMIWPDKNDNWLDQLVQTVWSITIRLFLVLIISAAAYSFLASVSQNHITYSIVNVAIVITLFLQSAVLVPSIFNIHSRLQSKALRFDLEHYQKCIQLCIIVFLLSAVSGMFFPIFLLLYMDNITLILNLLYTAAFIGEIAISCMLAVNMLFISVNARVCCGLIDILIKQTHDRCITYESFTLIRDEITRRVDTTYYKTNSIVLVAILDVFVVVVLLLFLTNGASDGGYLAALCTLFVKEIPFLLVVFLQCAKVNEKSDLLVKLLGVNRWDVEQEPTRVIMYINAEADRISYPLAGMRLTSKEVYARFAVWAATLVVGVIKTAMN